MWLRKREKTKKKKYMNLEKNITNIICDLKPVIRVHYE